MGYLNLLMGDFEPGWREREWRWKCAAFGLKNRNFPQPLWHGDAPLDGKTILIYSDEGFGDAIQFSRYIPLAAARGGHVILEVEAALTRLMSGLSGLGDCLVKPASKLPEFDLHCPLSTLPLAFRTTLETIPSGVPYLAAPAAAVAEWEARLGPRTRPRVGLVWSGNPKHRRDLQRSLPLRALSSILELDASFVSLQKDVRADDEIVLRERNDVLKIDELLQDFADTAALIPCLDLVITVDTSVAHLAGALGRPVWLLLPFTPDWRWLLDREDSPWYPTARLFRQSQPREWTGVIERVRVALQDLIAAWRPPDR
jgi:hypothetical protein